jgi:coenzyme F420-reducing hydrogenase delta subunit
MGEVTIDPFACQACGVCVLECPVRAIDMSLHPRRDIAHKTKEAMDRSEVSEPAIVSFLDLHGNFDSGDVKTLAQNYPNILPVMVFGLRRVDTTHVLKALETGADGVLLAMCPHDNDPFPGIREATRERVARTAGLVDALGLDGNRVQLFEMPEQGLVDKSFLSDFLQKVRDVGPNPLRGR